MASDPTAADDAAEVEQLYQFGEGLNEAKEKSEHVSDYQGIINAAKGGSLKAKQLAAQLIPRFYKFFPSLTTEAVGAQFDLLEEDDLRIRIQAIRGLPLLCRDTPQYITKIVDVLGQLLNYEEKMEVDAAQKALISVLRQDVKASLEGLFKHVEIGLEDVREKVICFLRDKVFPLKAELLKPQVEMERYVTELVKKSLQDVTGDEFKMFMDFLKNLSIFGEGASSELVQELIAIIESQADLDAQFKVEDVEHIDRVISCMSMALPFFMRGASSNKFLNYLNKHILPVFEKLPETKRLDVLKTLAVISPYATAQVARHLLPSVVELLKKHMPARKIEEPNFNSLECLLYTFHQLAYKTPNTTNSLCGYKIVTGQPSDRLGEDFSDNYRDFDERLTSTEEVVKNAQKKLAQGMDYSKAMSAAKTEEKAKIKMEQQKNTTILRICTNIREMIKPLLSKAPTFISNTKIHLSWMESGKSIQPSANPTGANPTGNKRKITANNGSIAASTNKKLRGGGEGGPNQLVSRALEGLSQGSRYSGRGRGRGGRGRGRGRGRGYR